MRGKARLIQCLLICSLAVLFAACQAQINYPAPALTALKPPHTQAGQPGFVLTVEGSHFTPASAVLWNGSQRSTLFASTSEMTAEILASDIQSAGTASVTVFTPQPGGGVTQPQTFTIDPIPSPVPQITSLSPPGVLTGGAQFTLGVTGKNFVAQSIVTVNGSNRQTIFLNSTSLQASVLASDISNAGSIQIAVVNPPPGGGGSNIMPLAVKNPVPSLTSVAPTAVFAGSAGTPLTVTGANFVSNSAIVVNGVPRSTAFGGVTQLLTSLTAADFASGGISQVQVVNPPPGGGISSTLTFAVTPSELAGLPVLVDLAPDGTQANNGLCGAGCPNGPPALSAAGPSVSQTGELVAFASNSTNLVANPANTSSDIFVRDTCLKPTGSGTTSCNPTTFVASATPTGGAPDGPSAEPSLDGSGTHVAYTSTASNLVNYVNVNQGNPPTRQVYWQLVCTSTTVGGCTAGTAAAALVSISADGANPGNADSYNPVISSDGRYVAFVSLATNLVSGASVDGITPQVYLRDTCSIVPPLGSGSCTPMTYLVSTPDGTTGADGPSSHPAIANQGLFVSFTSSAPNLGAPIPNPSPVNEVFVRSTCVTTIGSVSNTCAPATSLVSTVDGTTPADGQSSESAISSDGRFAAFASTATTLITGVGPTQQVYVRDTCTGVVVTTPTTCTPSIVLVSTNGTTPGNAPSENPSINQCGTTTATTTSCASGQFIAFASFATNLGSNVANGVENVYVRNACSPLPTTTTACVSYTLLVSQPAGTPPPPALSNSFAPAIGGDGQTVSFISFASNLVPRDTNAFEDVFLAGAALTFNVTVTLQGTGSGSVTDGTSQISCVQKAATSTTPITESGTCSGRYISGSTVTLTATATTGSGATFTGWGGTATTAPNASCTVTTSSTTSGTCTFSIVQDLTATASFK